MALRVGPARTIFRALAVGGAFVSAPAATALTIVWIALVAGQALATRAMALGDALRVLGAGETVANLDALQDSQRIHSTGLVVPAIVVADAVRYRWNFADRGYWVPGVVVLALARRVALPVQFASLVGAADYLSAGIDALSDSGV